MAMHTFIISLFALRGQSTMLESGVDDYYEQNDAAAQKANAKTEDELALKMYTELVQQKPIAKCGSLKSFVTAYADDPIKWVENDYNGAVCTGADGNKKCTGGNPEFDHDQKFEDAVQMGKMNENQATLKTAIKTVAKAVTTKCHDLWHLILCPLTGMRFLSPYEFVFKSTVPFNVENGVGIEVEPWTKAYNHVKCGNENVQCAKGVNKTKLVRLFQEEKGRTLVKEEKPKVADGQQSYGGGILPQTETIVALQDFWKSAEQRVFKNDDCEASVDAFCYLTVMASVYEVEELNLDGCYELRAACTQRNVDLKHGAPPQRHAPARTGTEGYNKVVKEFVECGVPWVGGVSGSVLEQFAYAKKKEVPMNDAFVLHWMSLYTLGGFHSMGEVWAALRPMLEKFGDLKQMKLEAVPSPLDLNGACPKVNMEDEFLKALAIVVEAVKADVDKLK